MNNNILIIVIPSLVTGLCALAGVRLTNRHNLKCLRYSEVNTNTRKASQKIFALAFKITHSNAMHFLMVPPYGVKEDIDIDLKDTLTHAVYCHKEEIDKSLAQLYKFCRGTTGVDCEIPDMALSQKVLIICRKRLKEKWHFNLK